MQICIFEDELAQNFLPIVYTRPVYSLLCGATSLLTKILSVSPRSEVALLARPQLRQMMEEEFPEYRVNAIRQEETLLVNGRVIADAELGSYLRKGRERTKLVKEGEIVAVRIPRSDLILCLSFNRFCG